jgi:hypothetical protein
MQFFSHYKKLFRVNKNKKVTVWGNIKKFGSSFVLQDKFFIRRTGIGLLMVENDSLIPAKSGTTFRFFTGAYIPNDTQEEIYFPAQKAPKTVEDYNIFLAYSPI